MSLAFILTSQPGPHRYSQEWKGRGQKSHTKGKQARRIWILGLCKDPLPSPHQPPAIKLEETRPGTVGAPDTALISLPGCASVCSVPTFSEVLGLICPALSRDLRDIWDSQYHAVDPAQGSEGRFIGRQASLADSQSEPSSHPQVNSG